MTLRLRPYALLFSLVLALLSPSLASAEAALSPAAQNGNLAATNLAHHQFTGEQHGLDGCTPVVQTGIKVLTGKGLAQGFGPQSGKQAMCLPILVARHVHHRTKAARVVQAQGATIGHEIEVIVRAGRRRGHLHRQAARHAQVQQERVPATEIEDQVLGAPREALHHSADQCVRLAAQRPAQGLADADRGHGGTCQRLTQAAAGGFDFGKFRHRQYDFRPWIIMG